MKALFGRCGAALLLCLAIGVALGLSGCQGAKSRSNTLSHPEPTTKAERRGDAYLKSGSLQGALQEYDRALAEGAPSHVINWRKGNAFFSARMWEKAYLHFRKAINEEPDWALAQEGAGFAAFEMGEFRNALGYFKRSSELNPDNWVPYAFLAVIQKVLGNDAAAQEANQLALDLAGEDKILADATIKRAYAKAVVVFEEQGDVTGAEVAASGDDPLSRLESLAAAEPGAAPETAAEDAESTGGWEVVEQKRLPGQILGMNGTVPANATLPAPTNATMAAGAGNATEDAPVAAPDGNATGEAEAVRELATANATNATAESGLTMTEDGSVTVIESPGYEDMNGTLAMSPNATGVNATGVKATADNATAMQAEARPAPTPAGEPQAATQEAASEAALAKPEPPLAETAPETAEVAPAAAEPEKAAAAPETAEPEKAEPASAAAVAAKPAPAEAQEPEAAEQAEPRDMRVAEAGMVYAVLESSWRDEPDALKRIEDLTNRGVRAHLVPSQVEGKGFWYRVMIGPRKKLQAVKDIKVELQKRFGLTDLVILKVPESKFKD